MPSSPPDSSDSPTRSAMPSADDAPAPDARRPPAGLGAPAPLTWRVNAGLFLATAASCFLTMYYFEPTRLGAVHAAQFTAALLAILVSHEFGHYIAARIH